MSVWYTHSFIIRFPKAFANTIDREHQSWVQLSWLLPSTYSHTGRTGGDHQDALVLRGWRLSSSRTWNPVTSPWMKQLMWLRIIPSGDWSLRLALHTPVGASQNRSFNMFLTARHHKWCLLCISGTDAKSNSYRAAQRKCELLVVFVDCVLCIEIVRFYALCVFPVQCLMSMLLSSSLLSVP